MAYTRTAVSYTHLDVYKRQVLGPRKTSEGWKLRKNYEIYKRIENITETMRKRRLLFFGHLYRKDDNRLTKKIFRYL